ncbi:ATP-dependent exonuclase V beta subunit, helicase and exonuclease domain-containing [Desulfosporosinus acidiphilus SJ4]|uniref:DNA 3'-5' helicase n=1 Tax=Desulfosporosinus acidiphilus (strain DSM 22704 / JCM 16185 / SJ4) TaxID=646529 RepID=I4DAD4_DESAJ|nr:UvrD-helicase domain-containing protein [Desulfosporosinus acidiphilus]AFM42758.1 ATP-dependent exonuclase V beta subunit, helicase and exonuclease domain-containing [Desulfosporosinus acidiphilus SJ4]
MPKNKPSDLLERRKIEKSLQINYVVEAGAGAGKTTCLIRRMLSLVKSGAITVGQMSAITFTRKAATELRERFQTELEEACRTEQVSEVKERLQQALIDLDESFLGTIHSFCASLLRERSVEAGLDPEFEELNSIEETQLQDNVWESYLLNVKFDSPQLLDSLNNIGIKVTELKPAFGYLSQYPDVLMAYTEVLKPDIKQAFERLTLLVKRAKQTLPSQEPEKGWDSLQKAILKANRQLEYFDLTIESNMISLLKIFDRQFKVTQKGWNTAGEAKQFRDEFNNFAEGNVTPLMQTWREYCHHILIEFIIPAVRLYEQERFKRSTLNFQDLLLITRNMLRDHPQVRTYFQGKYPRILVDEFQDTDPLQAEILFYLTGQDTDEKDWRKLIPKRGALFVVGDQKQSIYRFRRADIETYNLVKRLIVAGGGEVLKLTSNFRSVEALGDFLNPIFRRIFPELESPYQAEFSPLQALRPNGNAAVGVRILNIPEEYTNKDEIFSADADLIARYIRHSLDKGISQIQPDCHSSGEQTLKAEPRDFLILLRFKDSMDCYARALEKHGIPFGITGASSLKNSRELIELYKLVRVLDDPDNQVLLIGVLKGMFFGISDDDLYQIKRAGGNFNIFSPIPEEIDTELTHKYGNALNKLRDYFNLIGQSMPTVVLSKIIADIGLVPFTIGINGSQSRCAYLYQAVELLRHAERSGKTRFDQMVIVLGSLLSASNEEELNLSAKEENVVRLMNLHKAKGLEAPVVFLAQPYKKVPERVEIHIRRQGQEPVGYFAFTRQKGFQTECLAQPLGWEDYKDDELRYLSAEEDRLVYVAATRSKNLLIVSRSLKDKDMRKNPWALLLEGAAEELIVPEQAVKLLDKEDLTVEFKPQHFIEANEHFHDWIANSSIPTYRTESPTGLKRNLFTHEIKRGSGGGISWGLVIHKVFEELVKGEDELDRIILMALQENGEPPDRKDEVIQVVESFRKSDLWKRIVKADIRYTEVPFSLKVTPNDPFFAQLTMEKEDAIAVVLSGVIDLVFKEHESWVIVDYKADRVQDVSDLSTIIEYYSQQVKTYCHVWEDITGENCSGEIYFIDKEQVMSVC